MAFEKRLLEFTDEDLGAVCDAIAALRDGEWCNIEPFVEPEELEDLRRRTPHPLVRMFMKAGAPIPLGTVARTGATYAVGLEHPHAARAIPFLRDEGLATPREWRVKQDHPRRGIVLDVATTTPPADLVRWILGATRLLAAVRIDRQWTALVHTER